ncbi:MAG: hypothetical protein IIC53_01390 [Proteobacteria bacterium]|nr:hypothetical protein [Pseudomonadota bacterium]
MTKVFIGGSRRVSRFNAQIRERLDKIMEKGFPIVVGDANGADKAVQQYLHSKHYQNVEVFCSNGICRNNIGNWPTRSIPAETRNRTAEFYSAKDRVMAQEATVGLMIWDGRSVGTLLNVFRLLSLQKKAVIYTVPEKLFLEFRSGVEWDNFLASRDVGLRHKVEQRAKLETVPKNQPFQTSFFG